VIHIYELGNVIVIVVVLLQVDAGLHPELEGCPTGYNLALMACNDGASPWDGYSFLPFAFSCLNLPPWLRHTLAMMHISAIWPGG
jgi:hypothetical protein